VDLTVVAQNPGVATRNVALGQATVAASLLLDSMTSTFTAEAWVLRLGGATAAVALCAPVFRDRVKFRAAVVGDWVVDRSLDVSAPSSSDRSTRVRSRRSV